MYNYVIHQSNTPPQCTVSTDFELNSLLVAAVLADFYYTSLQLHGFNLCVY